MSLIKRPQIALFSAMWGYNEKVPICNQKGTFTIIWSFWHPDLRLHTQFSSVMSDFLQPHGLQHDRLPRPSLYPGICSNSCPLSQWCYLTISSSATLVFFLQSFPASGSFPMSRFFTSGGQSIRASVPPMNIQDWFPLGFTGLISLLSKNHQK